MGGGDQRLQPAAAPSLSPSSGYPPRESLEGRIFGGVEDALKYMFMPQGMVETPENQSPGLAGLLAHAFDPQTYVDQLSQSAQTIRQDPTSREAFRDYALAAGMLAPGVPKGMRAFQEATGGERLVAASEWGSAMRSGGKEPPPPGAGAERVTEATQRAPDGKIFKGWDHLDATLKAEEAGYNIESLEAGFATNKRPFLDREEAFRVAKKEIPSLRPHEDFTNPSLGAENLAQARKAAPQMTSNYHASLDQHLNENYGWRLMTDQEAPGRQKIIDANGRDIAHFAGGVKGDKLILSNVEALADPATKQTAKGLGLVDKIFQHAAQFTKENGLEVYTSARTSPITEAKYQKYFVEPFAPEIHAPSGRSVGAEPTTGGIPSREEIGISSGAEPPPPGAGIEQAGGQGVKAGVTVYGTKTGTERSAGIKTRESRGIGGEVSNLRSDQPAESMLVRPDAVKPLPIHERGQWQKGGCWALVDALKKQIPSGEFLGVKEPDGFAHVGLKVGDNVIDANGIQSLEAFRRKWDFNAERSGVGMKLEPMSRDEVAAKFNQSVGSELDVKTGRYTYPSLVGKPADEAVLRMLGVKKAK